MDIKKLDMVAEYYSTEGCTYKRAEKYAKEGKAVYVSQEAPHKRLLLMEGVPSHYLMASLSYEKGEIRSWDTYDITKCYPESCEVTRLTEDGKDMVAFDIDEQDMIQQFGETGKADTIRHLESVIPLIRDKQTQGILVDTKGKLDALSDGDCADLIAYVKKRKDIEHGHSLKVRLEQAKAKVKARDAEQQHRAQDRQRQ